MDSYATVPFFPPTNAMNAEESLLVRSVQEGKPGSFQMFVERYESRIFSILGCLLGDPERVERVAQNVFVDVHHSIRKFRGGISILAWLYEKAAGHALTEAQRVRQDPQRQRVLDILGRLDERERLLLILRDARGCSLPELSDLFQVDEATMRFDLLQARRRAVRVTPGISV